MRASTGEVGTEPGGLELQTEIGIEELERGQGHPGECLV